MRAAVEIATLIDRESHVRGGSPKVAGTGFTVRRIVGWHKMGMSPEKIALEYPHLSLAQVHAALAYYHANRDEIESDIAAEERLNDDWQSRRLLVQSEIREYRGKLKWQGDLDTMRTDRVQD